jgi:hypothetical protein
MSTREKRSMVNDLLGTGTATSIGKVQIVVKRRCAPTATSKEMDLNQ